MSVLTFIFILGLVIIAVLAGIAGRLLWQLRQQRLAAQARARHWASEARDSIRILAGSLLAGQVGGSEAALRIAVLLDQPAQPQSLRQRGEVFTEMAAQLAHIPTHKDWKALSSQQRQAYTAEMDALEARYREPLRQGAEALLAAL